MYIDILFIDESQRGKGYGKLLLQQAESAARLQGGYMAHLDTFDWQAKSFYVNAGYEVFGQLEKLSAQSYSILYEENFKSINASTH